MMIFLMTILIGQTSETVAFNKCKIQDFKGKCSVYKVYDVPKRSSYYANKIKNSTK